MNGSNWLLIALVGLGITAVAGAIAQFTSKD